MRKDEAIYLRHLSLKPGMAPDTSNFPLSLPFVAQLDLEFRCSVTFLVGENGCGKSTLMEATILKASKGRLFFQVGVSSPVCRSAGCTAPES
jgi:predicted ATPase